MGGLQEGASTSSPKVELLWQTAPMLASWAAPQGQLRVKPHQRPAIVHPHMTSGLLLSIGRASVPASLLAPKRYFAKTTHRGFLPLPLCSGPHSFPAGSLVLPGTSLLHCRSQQGWSAKPSKDQHSNFLSDVSDSWPTLHTLPACKPSASSRKPRVFSRLNFSSKPCSSQPVFLS
jgi:hypothetical protein